MSGVLRAFSGGKKFDTLRNTKNGALEGQIGGLISRYGSNQTANQANLDSFINKYMSGNAAADSRTVQEIGAVDDYYDGGIAKSMAAMRARRAEAREAASNRAVNEALRDRNLGRIGEDAGDGSYNKRMAIKANRDIRVDGALEDSNLERQDFGELERARMGLLGARTGLADANAQRQLVPNQARREDMAANMKELGYLGELDRGNNFYGLQQKKSGLDKWADALDGVTGQVQNDASMLGSVYGAAQGGGGGGGASM